MKTAMQELIDYMKTYFHLTDESLEMFDKALEKEKEQLEEARLKGYGQKLKDGNIEEGVFFDKPEDYHYYKTITNQNK
jgi:hypothetical protein